MYMMYIVYILYLDFRVLFCKSLFVYPFVLFLLAIVVLSVLRFTTSDYPFKVLISPLSNVMCRVRLCFRLKYISFSANNDKLQQSFFTFLLAHGLSNTHARHVLQCFVPSKTSEGYLLVSFICLC